MDMQHSDFLDRRIDRWWAYRHQQHLGAIRDSLRVIRAVHGRAAAGGCLLLPAHLANWAEMLFHGCLLHLLLGAARVFEHRTSASVEIQ